MTEMDIANSIGVGPMVLISLALGLGIAITVMNIATIWPKAKSAPAVHKHVYHVSGLASMKWDHAVERMYIGKCNCGAATQGNGYGWQECAAGKHDQDHGLVHRNQIIFDSLAIWKANS